MPEVPDPFSGMEDWAQEVEKRVTREHSRGRMVRALAAPFRGARHGTRWLTQPYPIIALTVVALIAIAGLASTVDIDEDGSSQAYPTQSHPVGVYATTSGSAAPTDPFDGTPAATYPEAEAGITMPAATAAGPFDAALIADHLATVRQALIAGRLDQRMLVDHDPSVFLAMLAPGSSEVVAAWFSANDFSGIATQLAPGATLLPELPRVSGRMTLSATTDSGDRPCLEIVTNYVWVYPLEGQQNGAGSRLVVIHDEVRWAFYAQGTVRDQDLGPWIQATTSYAYNVNCAQIDQSLIALPGDSAAPVTEPSADDPDQYFNPDRSLDIVDTCGAQTA